MLGTIGPTDKGITFSVQSPDGDLFTATHDGNGGWEIYDSRAKIPSITVQVIVERSVVQYLLDSVICAK